MNEIGVNTILTKSDYHRLEVHNSINRHLKKLKEVKIYIYNSYFRIKQFPLVNYFQMA